MSRSDMVPPHPERRLVGRYSLIHLSSHMAFPNAVHLGHYPQAAFLKKNPSCTPLQGQANWRVVLDAISKSAFFYKPVFKYIFIHY
jgi:hypothetical protein